MQKTDPRVRRTRALIVDAFLALFHEKGFNAISVQEIAERATVNRATFYSHFLDKYDLLDQVVGEQFRARLAERLPEDAPFSDQNLLTLIIVVLESVAAIDGHCQPTSRDLAPIIQRRVQQEIEDFFRGWLASARQGGPIQHSTAATVLSWALFGSGVAWTREQQSQSLPAFAHQVFALLKASLVPVGQDLAVPALAVAR